MAGRPWLFVEVEEILYEAIVSTATVQVLLIDLHSTLTAQRGQVPLQVLQSKSARAKICLSWAYPAKNKLVLCARHCIIMEPATK